MGGKTNAGGKSKDYFGTVAGLVCAGPVSELVAIVNDGHIIWPVADRGKWVAVLPSNGTYKAGEMVNWIGRIWKALSEHVPTSANAPGSSVGANYWAEVTVKRTDPGVTNPYFVDLGRTGGLIFYWGEADQVLATTPPMAVPELATAGHPPYRRQCFVVLKNWLFGRERVTSPSLSITVRRIPQQDIITGDAAVLDASGQANPLAVDAEVMTSADWGLAQDPFTLDSLSWATEANLAKQSAGNLYLSPVLLQSISGRSFFAQSLTYGDRWLRLNRDGFIEAGHWLHSQAVPAFTPANTIDYNDAEEVPAYTTQGWGETFSGARVTYTNRNESYRDSVAEAVSGWNLAVTGVDAMQAVDMPWIQRQAQALAWATEVAKIYAEPDLKSSLEVRGPKVRDLQAGDLILFTHDPLSLSVACRIVQKGLAAPPADRATLSIARERGLAVLPYAPTLSAVETTPYPDPETLAVWHVLQAAPSFSGLQGVNLMFLSMRTNPLTLGFHVWFLRDEASGVYVDLGIQRNFGVQGTFRQAYSATLPPLGTSPPDDDSGTLQLNLHAAALAVDINAILAQQTADAINDGRLILVACAGGNPNLFEFMTVKSVTPVSSYYQFKVRRAQFGTSQRAFAAGDPAFVIERKVVEFFTHVSFASYITSGATGKFKLVTFNAGKEANIADQPEIAFAFTNPYAPVFTWNSIRAGGLEITDYTQSFPTSTEFSVNLTVTDPDKDLNGVTLTAVSGANTKPLFSGIANPRESLSRTITFFLAEGAWSIFGTANDLSGLVTNSQATIPAGQPSAGSPVVLKVQNTAQNASTTPVANRKSDDYLGTTLAVQITAAGVTSIWYVETAYGAAPPPKGAGWTQVLGTVANRTVALPSSLHFYSATTGKADSVIIEELYARDLGGNN